MENNKGDRILAKLVIFSIVRIINEREAHGPVSSFGLFWTCDIQNDATEIVWSVGVFVGLFVDTTQFILKATATKKGLEHSNKAMERRIDIFLESFHLQWFCMELQRRCDAALQGSR